MGQLTGFDVAFVAAETAGAAHVTFFAIYDPSTAPGGIVTLDDVAAHIGSRLGAHRIFRSGLLASRSIWITRTGCAPRTSNSASTWR